ncbi:MAG: DMT family transporter [Deltaproteobacteria bacterium]|nr:DMT family transporter [Deltaproteobacteria bacterium]
MGVVFGLVAAVFWGTADFLARLAAERVGSVRTIFYMQCLGTLFMGCVVLVPAAQPSWPSAQVLLLAIVLGLMNVTGGSLLYRALEIGTVSLVSPVSSTFSAVTAMLAIVVAGERPPMLTLFGLVLCVLGVIAASVPPKSATTISRRGIGLAALAALSWGISFFALRYVVRDLGPYFPVWVSRATSAIALGLLALARRQKLPAPKGAWLFIAGIAVFDSAAFAFYNLGISAALTSVVAVIASLYAAWTVLLAFFILRERLGAIQWAAVAVIFLGIGLVSGG